MNRLLKQFQPISNSSVSELYEWQSVYAGHSHSVQFCHSSHTIAVMAMTIASHYSLTALLTYARHYVELADTISTEACKS